MLGNAEIIEVVARKMKEYRVKKLVVDPVMVAKSGDSLLRKDAEENLVRKLIPLSTVVTPNLPEASVLSGLRVRSLDEMKKAAQRIHALGAGNVVIKGGHLGGMAIDLLYDGTKHYEFEGKRIDRRNTHGTGCTFASAIATFLALGETIPEAVRKAKAFIALAIESGLPIGRGIGPTNPFAYVLREMERYRVVQELKRAFSILEKEKAGGKFRSARLHQRSIRYFLKFAGGM